jgi:hypothetical protein
MAQAATHLMNENAILPPNKRNIHVVHTDHTSYTLWYPLVIEQKTIENGHL